MPNGFGPQMMGPPMGMGGMGGMRGRQQLPPISQLQPGPIDRYQMMLRERLQQQYRQQMESDLARGRERARQLFGEGALGRVEEERPEEVSRLLGAFQQQAELGYTAPQYEALRERVTGGIQRGLATQRRQAAIQRRAAGIRGGLAARQEAAQARQLALSRQRAQQELGFQDIALRERGRGAYAQALGAARAGELARRQFNLAQRAREMQGRLAIEMGYGSLGAAMRGAAEKYIAGQQQVEAARAQTGGGGK